MHTQGTQMPVRSRLKLVIAEHNVERMKKGQKPLTTREIARGAGIAESTLTGVSSGRLQMASYRTLAALCRYFRVQPGELLEYYEEGEESDSEQQEHPPPPR